MAMIMQMHCFRFVTFDFIVCSICDTHSPATIFVFCIKTNYNEIIDSLCITQACLEWHGKTCMFAILDTHYAVRYRLAESTGIRRKGGLNFAPNSPSGISTSAIFHTPNQRRMA